MKLFTPAALTSIMLKFSDISEGTFLTFTAAQQQHGAFSVCLPLNLFFFVWLCRAKRLARRAWSSFTKTGSPVRTRFHLWRTRTAACRLPFPSPPTSPPPTPMLSWKTKCPKCRGAAAFPGGFLQAYIVNLHTWRLWKTVRCIVTPGCCITVFSPAAVPPHLQLYDRRDDDLLQTAHPGRARWASCHTRLSCRPAQTEACENHKHRPDSRWDRRNLTGVRDAFNICGCV